MVDSLDNSLYSDVRLGYRPNVQKGIYGELGYSYMFSGKGEVSSDHLKRALGRSNLPDNPAQYRVQSNVQSATLHGGYRIPVMKQVGVTAEIGLVKPFYSSVTVNYDNHLSSTEEYKDSKKIQHILQNTIVWTGSIWLSYIL